MEIERNIVQKYFNKEILDFEFIGSGWHNNIYLINKEYVARLGFTEHGKLKMKVYNSIQNNINLPIGTPKYDSLNFIDDTKYTVLAIYKFFNGESVNFKKLNPKNILLLSKTISEIHKLDFPDMFGKPNITETIQAEFDDLRNCVFQFLSKTEREFVNNLYSKYLQSNTIKKVIPLFVHGDITPKNMVLSNNILIALIDWDGIHYNDPMFDFSRFSINEFDMLINNYPNKEILGEDIFFRYLFYRIRKHTYAMFYAVDNELYKPMWKDLYDKFKRIKKEYEHLYNLL